MPIFDSYKSFVVYDMKQLSGRLGHLIQFVNHYSGFKDFMLISGVVMCTVCSFGMAIVFTTFKWKIVFFSVLYVEIFRILHDHRCRMSFSTRRLHARLITQLSVQVFIIYCHFTLSNLHYSGVNSICRINMSAICASNAHTVRISISDELWVVFRFLVQWLWKLKHLFS